jgi:hypothetical protein
VDRLPVESPAFGAQLRSGALRIASMNGLCCCRHSWPQKCTRLSRTPPNRTVVLQLPQVPIFSPASQFRGYRLLPAHQRFPISISSAIQILSPSVPMLNFVRRRHRQLAQSRTSIHGCRACWPTSFGPSPDECCAAGGVGGRPQTS